MFTFWAAVIAFNVFQGLYYGVRSALFMDVTTPAVAATRAAARRSKVARKVRIRAHPFSRRGLDCGGSRGTGKGGRAGDP